MTEDLTGDNGFAFWNRLGELAARQRAPYYARIASGVRDDAEFRASYDLARPNKMGTSNLTGAVHFLLRCGDDHQLRAYYPSLGGTKKVEDADPYPLFREFCLTRRKELAALIDTRTTNINEIGRSAILHAGFRALAQRASQPLHLIEIGPSAGLNLLWDRYGAEYVRGSEVFAAEPRQAPITLRTELRGNGIPPLGPVPRVARRLGLELNPVDLTDPGQREWQKALAWPEHPERLERLERALDMFVAAIPEIRGGDALVNLPAALKEAEPSSTVCVYHTFSVYQFTQDMKARLESILHQFSATRPLWRLSWDGWDGGDAYPLRLMRYDAGRVSEFELGTAEYTGAWLEWRYGAFG